MPSLTPTHPATRLGAVPPVAHEQGGAFTRAQAVAAGWSERQVDRRLAAGHWRRVVGRGLTSLPGPDAGWRRAWAAQLTWPEAVIALTDAALIHGFPVHRAAPSVVYSPAGRRPMTGLSALRRALPDEDVDLLGELVLTTRRRTAHDCLALLDWPEALELYAWLSTREVVTRDDLSGWALAETGCHGTPQLVRLLHVTRHGAVSRAEDLLHQVLRRGHLVEWRAGVPIDDDAGRIGVFDVVFTRHRLVIEVDGQLAHSTPKAFQDDRRKQNRLVNAGYRVLRFTWRDLVDHPDRVLAEIRRALTEDHRWIAFHSG